MSTTTGSTSINPDLGWSQLKETILMLNLSVAQIDQSMNEGNSSVETLGSSFTALATNLSDIQSSVEKMNDDNSQKTKLIVQDSATTEAAEARMKEGHECVDWYFCKKEL